MSPRFPLFASLYATLRGFDGRIFTALMGELPTFLTLFIFRNLRQSHSGQDSTCDEVVSRVTNSLAFSSIRIISGATYPISRPQQLLLLCDVRITLTKRTNVTPSHSSINPPFHFLLGEFLTRRFSILVDLLLLNFVYTVFPHVVGVTMLGAPILVYTHGSAYVMFVPFPFLSFLTVYRVFPVVIRLVTPFNGLRDSYHVVC